MNNSRGFKTSDSWHGNVHDDHLGAQFAREADGILAIVGFPAKIPFRIGAQDALHATAYHCMIIHDQNTWHGPSHNSAAPNAEVRCSGGLWPMCILNIVQF